MFNINVREINWKLYIENYCLGIKKYLLKEDMAKMDKCRKALAKHVLYKCINLLYS